MKSFISFFTLIAIIFSGFFFIDNRYAQVDNVKQIEERLDYKIANDELISIQNRRWRLEDKYDNKMPETIKEEHRELLSKEELIKKKIDSMMKEDGRKINR